MADQTGLPEQAELADLMGATFPIPDDEAAIIAGAATPRPLTGPQQAPPTPVLPQAPGPAQASAPPTPDMQHAPGSLVSLVLGAGFGRACVAAFSEVIGVPLEDIDSHLLGCI